MSKHVLIADSGATKAEWVLLSDGRKSRAETPGISPYFMNADAIQSTLHEHLKPSFLKTPISQVFFYGTGCAARSNAQLVKKSLLTIWPKADIQVFDDLLGATRSLCGHESSPVFWAPDPVPPFTMEKKSPSNVRVLAMH
jgi:hypothetical protein